jgi:DinB superfamily
MEHHLDQTISLLTRTPASLHALLHGLPDTWTLQNEGEDTWNVASVIGHLSHCERTDWMPRVQMILQSGENQTFDRLDRQAHLEESRGKSMEQLLAEFAHLRSQNLNELRTLNLTADATPPSEP